MSATLKGSTFAKQIAGYRALKLATYRQTAAGRMLGDDLVPESTLWQWLWAMGIKVPPQEFLSAPALFGIVFLFMALFYSAIVIFVFAVGAMEHGFSMPTSLTIPEVLIAGIVISATVATVAMLSADREKRGFGFVKWDEFESFDQPYGPTLKEIIAAQSDQRPEPAESAIATPAVQRSPEISAVASNEAAAFKQVLKEITPHVYVTYALIGASLLVFALMVLSGASFWKPSVTDLLRWGAEYGPRTVNGQSWRLFTALFAHIGITHLFYNMVALYYVGPVVERMLGNIRFLQLYLLAGLGGGLWSTYSSPLQVTAGASGAIFGISAALLTLLLRQHLSIPKQMASRLKRSVLIFIGFNLIYGLLPGVSFTAHFGGLVVGLCGGLLLGQPSTAEAFAKRATRTAALAMASIVLVIGGILSLNAHYTNLSSLIALLHRGNITVNKFKHAEESVQNKQLSDADFATLIDKELLPEWTNTRAALSELTPLPRNLQRDAIVNYMTLRKEHWEAVLNAERQAKGGLLLGPEKELSKADKMQLPDAQPNYIGAEVDLEFASSDATVKGDQLVQLQQLATRVKSLDQGEQTKNMDRNVSFEDFNEWLEQEQLPELRSIQQSFADLPQLPPRLGQDATEILQHLRLQQEKWELRVAYRHYNQAAKIADHKRSRADNAAQEIRFASGLPVPY